ncbi:MAG: ABC transporter substrate-binding protein [Verrucomicrobiota bacterium]|nr:ABC transporter substrate-binding protein [Verrucomicrobiota bacterium]
MKIIRVLSVVLFGLATARGADKIVLRVGHFPNVTHVQGLVAHALSRQGKGWFEERLGPNVEIQWFTYNAGPSAMEALFANSIDLTYVGPSPALNAYSKSRGEEVRILSGAANGGAALVVQADQNLKTPGDFRGKKIATPQLGNTQDVSCRAWLVAGGLKITQLGGDAQVLPTQNPDQLSLFQQKQLDAVWTAEPWVSRLEIEAGAKAVVEETDSTITVLVSSVKFLSNNADLAKKFAQAHRELTDWISKNPEEAQKLVQAEVAEETKGKVSAELIAHAWKRITLTNEITRESLENFVAKAKAAGFMRDAPDLGRLLVNP